MHTCRICGNDTNNTEYVVKEMLLGTREEFRYFECGQCGCVQIVDIPGDMSPYYPPAYRDILHRTRHKNNISFLRRMLKNRWKQAYIDRHLRLNRVFIHFFGQPFVPRWILETGIHTNSPILEIGCGDGHLLFHMRGIGFKDLTGIDRYMRFEQYQPAGIRLLIQDLSNLEGAKKTYELIMLHHSFEHISEQFETLRQIRELLTPDGRVLIRIPVASSFAWREYGTNWFALDPPRHFYLHTKDSLQWLAEKTEFVIASLYYDAIPQNLWASEQYARDIPYIDERSLKFGLDKSIFTQQDVETFQRKTQELNESEDGDMACFVLKKK